MNITLDSFKIGEVFKMKKKHSCGSFEFEIIRIGMDFRIKCIGCGHQVTLTRDRFLKNVKSLMKS